MGAEERQPSCLKCNCSNGSYIKLCGSLQVCLGVQVFRACKTILPHTWESESIPNPCSPFAYATTVAHRNPLIPANYSPPLKVRTAEVLFFVIPFRKFMSPAPSRLSAARTHHHVGSCVSGELRLASMVKKLPEPQTYVE